MTDKRLDFSVLPNGFLIETALLLPFYQSSWHPEFMSDLWRQDIQSKLMKLTYRPALNYSYFNDGSMVLPDGLVVKFLMSDDVNNRMRFYRSGHTHNNYIIHDFPNPTNIADIKHEYDEIEVSEVVAVQPLGVHPDYADHGKELGMEVVEL